MSSPPTTLLPTFRSATVSELLSWSLSHALLKCASMFTFLAATRQPMELWLWAAPCLQQDPVRSSPTHRRLPERDLPGPGAAHRGFSGLGGQPALHRRDCHCARHHGHCGGHRGGSCGDGWEEQEEEPWKELGHRVADTNSEPAVLRGGAAEGLSVRSTCRLQWIITSVWKTCSRYKRHLEFCSCFIPL